MRSTMLLFPIVALGSIIGCSSKSATDDGGDGNNTACTVTLSGAITATLSCVASGDYALVTLGRSDLAISVRGGSPGFTLGLTTDGQLSSGTITQSGAGVEQAITTASNNNVIWSQVIGDPTRGTLSVTISSASLGSDGHTYTIHGTVDATLAADPATPGATGTVTAHVTF